MNTMFTGILLNLQKKYTKVNELQGITKQMAESLERNDLSSFQLLMKMRTQVMIELENIEYAQEELLQGLSENDEKQARGAISKEAEEMQFENPDLQRMNDIYKRIKRNLQTTIQLDKAISLKVGRDSSFYNK